MNIATIQQTNKNIKLIHLWKVTAHSLSKYNEEIDKIAKKARETNILNTKNNNNNK